MEAIGIILKRAREEKGLDLAQIAAKLRIRVQYLIELEDDIDNSTVSDVYKIGYTKLYSNFLDVDIESYLSELSLTAKPKFHTIEVVNLEKTKPPLMIIAGSIFCIILSVILIIIFKNSTPKTEPISIEQKSISHEAAQLFSHQDKLYLENSSTSKPIIVIGARASVKISLTDLQGKPIQQKQLNQGESFILPQHDYLVITVDAPDQVDFYEFSPITLTKKKLEAVAKQPSVN